MKFRTISGKKVPFGKVKIVMPEEVDPHRVTFHSPNVAERIVLGAKISKQNVSRSTENGVKVITITSEKFMEKKRRGFK